MNASDIVAVISLSASMAMNWKARFTIGHLSTGHDSSVESHCLNPGKSPERTP